MLQDGLVAFLPRASIGNFRFVGKPDVTRRQIAPTP
jgi:hypothetical protein